MDFVCLLLSVREKLRLSLLLSRIAFLLPGKPQSSFAERGLHRCRFVQVVLDAYDRRVTDARNGDVVQAVAKGIRKLDRDQFEPDKPIRQEKQKGLGRPHARERPRPFCFSSPINP